ncbi:Glutathione synthase/Ribosomal protein S6 modification enzyme (glutaminyl transferase)-like [hydrothermal vent metagenome]|uniref:Glutathione synthase/Ribosomal protein S6 modification enzyme (Glutaminyl transferase)-like n=1 Tax=hydrothermal vent metagenome TaxID=652676 RepID=A0A3B1BN84_9ZZZZ
MPDVKIGIIGIPGKWSTETLADSVAAKTGFRLVVDMQRVVLELEKQKPGRLFYDGQNLCSLDALIVKKISTIYSPNTLDRLELLRIAERAGVKVFSRAENILRLIDRLSCTITLKNNDIPMPETCITEDIETAIVAVENFSSAVFKPLYSTKAQGMCVIESNENKSLIEQQVRNFHSHNPMMYIQKKIESLSQDLGLVFMGGKYQGAYARISKDNSWNTTIDSGGHYADCQPGDDIIALAERAQAPFYLDFTTVDVAETEAGPIVFEVSAFGGFRGSLEGGGIHMADRYVDYVLLNLGK